MAGHGSTRIPCSRRQRWWAARMTTVFVIGIAALAACQPFGESNDPIRAAVDELAERDDCASHGGSWSIDTRRCGPEASTATAPTTRPE
jgi:hypothetical protein